MTFTFSGKIVIAEDGRAYRFSKEFGDIVGASADGLLYTRRHKGGYRGNRRGSKCPFGGYWAVTVGNHSAYVHQLVYNLFVGQVPAGMEIDHINADPDDNRVENLQAVTKSGNMRNPITRKRNLFQLSGAREKANSARRRRVAAFSDDGFMVCLYASVTEASESTGASRSDIMRVARGKRKHAGGYSWKYMENCK